MAFSYAVIADKHTNTISSPQSYSSITTQADSLLFFMVLTSFSTTARTVTGMTSTTFTGATLVGRQTGWHSSLYTAEWWYASGAGATDTFSVTWDATSGVSETEIVIVEVTDGANVMSYVQGATAAATNTTATVTLGSAVSAGNECLYLATWDDQSDSAVAGSGWTECYDQAGTISTIRVYGQYHPSPSGSQNGQVSSLTSQQTASALIEIDSAAGGGGGSSFTGWGIPIA